MGLQSIIEKSDFTNFLQCGAILQLDLYHFKLIWGPFHALTFNIDELEDQITVIYKPDFWDFISEKKINASALKGAKEMTLSREQLLYCLHRHEKSSPQFAWQNAQNDAFVEQFNWSQQQFKAKGLVKTVPIIEQTGRGIYTVSHLVQTLESLLEGKHFGTTYGFWKDGHGFLGQTPERILAWNAESKVASSMALAGTMALEPDVETLIEQDSKIVREHEIVVEDLKLILASARSNHQVNAEKRQILSLKYLVHLLTPISMTDVSLAEALRITEAIHPSAALGLYPRSKEKFNDWSQFQIQKKRKNFAAPFGFFQKNQIHVVAAIRNFFFSPTGVQIFSGCGITAESILETELAELQTKRNSVKKMMGFNE